MIVHVVLMRWKERATPEQIEKAKADFLALAAKIPGITGAYWGRVPATRGAKFSGGVVILAENHAALAAYNAHPEYAPLTRYVDAMVVRYTAADLVT